MIAKLNLFIESVRSSVNKIVLHVCVVTRDVRVLPLLGQCIKRNTFICCNTLSLSTVTCPVCCSVCHSDCICIPVYSLSAVTLSHCAVSSDSLSAVKLNHCAVSSEIPNGLSNNTVHSGIPSGLCTDMSVLINSTKINDWMCAIESDSNYINYFNRMGISPIIIDSGATAVTMTDVLLFDSLNENINPNITVSMGSVDNTKIIEGIGNNFLFSRMNYVKGLIWNLISLGALTQYPLCWKHSGEGREWTFYDTNGTEMLKAVCYTKNVFYLTEH